MQLRKEIDAVVADLNPPKEKTLGFSSAEVKRFAALTNLDDATGHARPCVFLIDAGVFSCAAPTQQSQNRVKNRCYCDHQSSQHDCPRVLAPNLIVNTAISRHQ